MKFNVHHRLYQAQGLYFVLFLLPLCVCYQNNFKTTYKKLAGHRLKGHVMRNHSNISVLHCGMRCSVTHGCQSYNYQNKTTLQRCELNDDTAQAAPGDYEADEMYNYYSIVRVDPQDFSCLPNPCQNGGTCHHGGSLSNFWCHCTRDYDGPLCTKFVPFGLLSKKPGQSCLHIKNSGAVAVSGPKWIDPGYSGTPFLVYCEATEGGGWLLVSNIIIPNSGQIPPRIFASSFRNISNYKDNNLFISATDLRQLQQVLPFSQLRFHCNKEQVGRKIDIITTQDPKGMAVVDYFTAKTDENPDSCGSFTRGSGDNSFLAQKCEKWRRGAGKWGHHTRKNEDRLFDHAFYVASTHHWSLLGSTFECDDLKGPLTPGDFWKIYVR